jgi:hypothetical protein
MMNFDLTSVISGIIPKRVVFAMLCKIVSDKVLFPVDKFDMIYVASDKDIFFVVYLPSDLRKVKDKRILEHYNNETKSHILPADDLEQINTMIDKYIESNMKDGDQIEVAKLKYFDDGKSVVLEMYFLDKDKNKQSLMQKLV